MKRRFLTAILAFLWITTAGFADWRLGPFERFDEANPILTPSSESIFHCPVQDRIVHWEAEHVFNPGAVVRNGKVYLIYRAEDNYGEGIGKHTSRLGLAESEDGIHFTRMQDPILFPDNDNQSLYEFPGGCEDPRIVETEEGLYVMTYTQWNRQVAVLAIATSHDLIHWKKQGYAFEGNFGKRWSKAGSIVCRQEGDRLIATKIQGKYWMYWGEGIIHAATSDDLISWTPVMDRDRRPIAILEPRPGKFDSILVESGPPAILKKEGIVLIYNGKNSIEQGDPHIFPRAYSAGQVLLDPNDPTRVISRSEECFLTPERPYEMKGQYLGGTVFVQGLVPFKGKWFLYYGTADSAIGVAACPQVSCAQMIEYAENHLPQSGILKSTGKFVYVDVDDDYIHRLVSFIEEDGFQEPPYFGDFDLVGAHISVIYPDEMEKFAIGDIDECGKRISFALRAGEVVHPPKWVYDEVFFLSVDAPELDKIREKYGLPKRGFPYHITIGVLPF